MMGQVDEQRGDNHLLFIRTYRFTLHVIRISTRSNQRLGRSMVAM
jgi:hypothetical protein